MAKTVISIEHLSKCYRLGVIGTGTAFGDLKRWWAKQRGKPDPYQKIGMAHHGNREGDTVWALKDINFTVEQGEAIGIIGRNGAGKSTLLKILSQVTAPTEGLVKVKGRIASLLEVGTGFHGELTGRENIYLNGAINGMNRAEVKRKLDEIVDFSGVEKYIDTPVKRYSSGMYVRLAFAVAAHLDPEILIVDEVLAVGDAEFQKKCLGKMGDVAHKGRTVLFVSHNMVAIQQLCQRALLLYKGKLNFSGPTGEVVSKYIQSVSIDKTSDLSERKDRQGNQLIKFTSVTMHDAKGNLITQVLSGQDISFRFHYESETEKTNNKMLVAFNVKNNQGYLITNINSVDSGQSKLNIFRRGYFECRWPKFNLRSGSYECTLFCSVQGEIVDWIESAFVINVDDGDYYKTGKMIDRQQGDILINHHWTSKSV